MGLKRQVQQKLGAPPAAAKIHGGAATPVVPVAVCETEAEAEPEPRQEPEPEPEPGAELPMYPGAAASARFTKLLPKPIGAKERERIELKRNRVDVLSKLCASFAHEKHGPETLGRVLSWSGGTVATAWQYLQEWERELTDEPAVPAKSPRLKSVAPNQKASARPSYARLRQRDVAGQHGTTAAIATVLATSRCARCMQQRDASTGACRCSAAGSVSLFAEQRNRRAGDDHDAAAIAVAGSVGTGSACAARDAWDPSPTLSAAVNPFLSAANSTQVTAAAAGIAMGGVSRGTADGSHDNESAEAAVGLQLGMGMGGGGDGMQPWAMKARLQPRPAMVDTVSAAVAATAVSGDVAPFAGDGGSHGIGSAGRGNGRGGSDQQQQRRPSSGRARGRSGRGGVRRRPSSASGGLQRALSLSSKSFNGGGATERSGGAAKSSSSPSMSSSQCSSSMIAHEVSIRRARGEQNRRAVKAVTVSSAKKCGKYQMEIGPKVRLSGLLMAASSAGSGNSDQASSSMHRDARPLLMA